MGSLLQHLIFAIIAIYIHFVIEPVTRAEGGILTLGIHQWNLTAEGVVWEFTKGADPEIHPIADAELDDAAVLLCFNQTAEGVISDDPTAFEETSYLGLYFINDEFKSLLPKLW
jgi:hypothetical protein